VGKLGASPPASAAQSAPALRRPGFAPSATRPALGGRPARQKQRLRRNRPSASRPSPCAPAWPALAAWHTTASSVY